jgi:hypothetical protein
MRVKGVLGSWGQKKSKIFFSIFDVETVRTVFLGVGETVVKKSKPESTSFLLR